MTDDVSTDLTPATAVDVEAALPHALRFDGKKRFRLSGEAMAQITAAHLLRCLEQSGFVVIKAQRRQFDRSARVRSTW
jgi:hypothetical protein